MPPVAVGVVEALAEGQGVADKLLSLALVRQLLLFGLALQLEGHTGAKMINCRSLFLFLLVKVAPIALFFSGVQVLAFQFSPILIKST